MNLSSNPFWVVAIAAGFVSASAPTSNAGPWLDSLFGRRPPAYPVGTPVAVGGQTAYLPAAAYVPPSYAPYAGSQITGGVMNAPLVQTQTVGYGGYSSLPPVNNAPLFAPGLPQTVAGYLPTAAYDSVWNRVPVTYYRPVTAYDPRYGTTVTSLQPCTSYQYLTQRPPTIAPRPLLGEYGLQANKWPSITGPGYNPTGLAVASGYPSYPPYQSFPNTGTAALAPTLSTVAPMASSGTSFGMPATSLPATTMNYNPLSPVAPTYSYPTTANYYSGGWQTAANPLDPNFQNAASYASNPMSALQPASAWVPSNCANGTCSQTAPPMQSPYVPGASSVTPVGPPTYSPAPITGYGTGAPGYGTGVPNAAPVYPNNPGTLINPAAPNVMPNNQILPPGNGIPGLADPESVRQPGLSNAMNTPSKQEIDVRTLPMVAIDRGPQKFTRESLSATSRDSAANAATSSSDVSLGAGTNQSQSTTVESPRIPDTLNSRENAVKPLFAPNDFDSKPRWNPSLLEPEERSVVGGKDPSANTVTIRDVSIRRIRLIPDELPPPSFRPVTKLK